MKVEQLMTRPVLACRPDHSVAEAARIMWENDCGCVPVIQAGDGLEGAVIGMITDRDVCMAAYTQGRPLSEIQVGSAMTRDVATCVPEDSLETALAVMETRQIHRIPVVDSSSRLVGMLSISDLARHVARPRRRASKDLTSARIGEIMRAVAAPRSSRAIQAA